MPTQQEMQRLVERMRIEMSDIARAHGRSANLPAPTESAAAVSVDDIATQFAPTRIGTQTMEQVQRIQRCLDCATANISSDFVPADSSDVSDQIRKGQAIGAEVNRMLGEAWQIDLELRLEVDSLRERLAEEENHEPCAYAAEQKAVLLEKLILLVFISLLLEAAKLCLLIVIQLLVVSRDLLATAYNALAGASSALEAAARTAIANGTIIPLGTAPNLDGRLALTFVDNAALGVALGAFRAQIPNLNALVGASNQVLTDALARLPRCLALQELARRLASRFLEVERILQPPRVEG